MPDGVVQWYEQKSGEGAVVRGGQVFRVHVADVEPAARHAGARVHFDIRREHGAERAVEIHLQQGTRTGHRHRRFGTLTGARRPDTKGSAPFPHPHPDLGRSLAEHPLEVVREWTDAISRGERDTARSLYAPNAVVHLAEADLVGQRQLDSWLDRHPALGCGQRATLRGHDTEVAACWEPAEPGTPVAGVRCRVEHGLIVDQWPLDPEYLWAEQTVEPGAEPLRIQSVVRGDVPEDAVSYARERIGQLARLIDEPILFARVKLSQASDPARTRPAFAQAFLDVNGDAVGAQVAAGSMLEAIDVLQRHLRDRVQHRATQRAALQRWSGQVERGQWHHGDLPSERTQYFDRPVDEREVVRHKSLATEELIPDEAIFDMEQLGYDFYLFCDLASGADSLIERAAEGRYLLTRLGVHEVDVGPSAYPVQTSTENPPTLTLGEAIERMNVGGEPLLFFENATTRRGNVCYHRYDGNYGVIALD
jgi:cold shock CspA family protein